jgi:hypothetical protein
MSKADSFQQRSEISSQIKQITIDSEFIPNNPHQSTFVILSGESFLSILSLVVRP